MLKPEDLVSLAVVVDQIKALCRAHSSGIVFLTTEENRMAQVHLNAGHVVTVVCRNKRGFVAIQLMRDIHRAHMRFDQSHIPAADSDELLTEVFFDYLSTAQPALSKPAETNEPGTDLTADVQITLQKLLAKFIGPMAEFICQDHFAGAPNALHAIDAIANEIPDKEDARKFRADAARAIGQRSTAS